MLIEKTENCNNSDYELIKNRLKEVEILDSIIPLDIRIRVKGINIFLTSCYK